MINLSPYADAESGTPAWKSGEKETAVAFISLTLYIILDVNVGIYRIFRRKQGLYYWSLIFATWGTAVVAVGNVLKNLKPEWGVIWPLWTLMINGGWSVYAPAELLILYSRLHLVNQNFRLHRWLLVMIMVGSFAVIVPNWVFIFGAYDIDPKISSVWSPRMAIIDRTSQASFTVMESVISGIYIHSLLGILRTKIDVKTRRVMRDLISVNITVVVMDLLVIVLIFLNQAQVAYPMQDFTYAFKYKIEFVVLNQLMAIATNGSRASTRKLHNFEQRRYKRPSRNLVLTGHSDDDISGIRLPFLSTFPECDEKGKQYQQPQYSMWANDDTGRNSVARPRPILSKQLHASNLSAPDNPMVEAHSTAAELSYDFQKDKSSLPPSVELYSTTSSHSHDHISSSLSGGTSDDIYLAPVADDVGKAYVLDALPQAPAQHRSQRNSLRQILFRRKKSRHGPENPSPKFNGDT